MSAFRLKWLFSFQFITLSEAFVTKSGALNPKLFDRIAASFVPRGGTPDFK